MPLAGGPSDKAGNSYERRWTVFAMLDLLDGRATTLRIEVPGEVGVGSEFRLMVGGRPEWHQVKRQRSGGPWTVTALISEQVLQPWQANLSRGEVCVFVSSTGAADLLEIAERSRSADSWDEFEREFLATNAVRKNFDRLLAAWSDLGGDAACLDGLRRIQVRLVGESELTSWINDRLRAQTTGAAPETVAAVLAQLADDSVHRELSAADVWKHLASHGVTPRDLSRDAAVIRSVAVSADAFIARLQPLHIGRRELLRAEAKSALDYLADGRRTVLAGAAGSGKSVVTAQVVKAASERGWPVFVLSADRLPEATTTTQLGSHLGLPDSPATVLAGVAAGGDSLLIVDQLDAVSTVSGRHPERQGLIGDLLTEARSYQRLRVLLVCRQFDIDHDRDLRSLTSERSSAVVTVGSLDDEQIGRALNDAGLSADLPSPLLQLLSVPLHLALYVELATVGVEDLESARSITDLYDRYWNAKRDACRLVRRGVDQWQTVVERLVQEMSDRQELAVPEAILDDVDQQAKVMASAGVVVFAQGRIAFLHETFFDYCFARCFVSSGGTLRDLLTKSEQDIFRRAQVRQILTYERGVDRVRYLADFKWLLTASDVRLHIKALVVALFDGIADPSVSEWELVRAVALDTESPLHLRAWQALRHNPAWFAIADTCGDWAAFLRGGGTIADRAIWAMSGWAAQHAVRVCQLLADAPKDLWPARRSGFLRSAEVHRSRPLVDLMLAAIDAGDFDGPEARLSNTLPQLVSAQPVWAIEVIAVLLRRGIASGTINLMDPSRLQSSRLGDLPELLTLGRVAPAEFVDSFLPLLLDLVRSNERPEWATTELLPDALWSFRIHDKHGSLSANILAGVGLGLATLARSDHAQAAKEFERLRAQPYMTAAFVLAVGYVGNAAEFADDVVDWLVATPGARCLGYANAPEWVSRQLVEAISPLCSAANLDRLVDALLYYAPPPERTFECLRFRGIAELCLLSGVDRSRRPERLERRLAELRRKFNRDDVAAPKEMSVGIIPPPIPEDHARHMSDRQWLKAMRRYSESDRSPENHRFGWTWSQSQVLENLVKEDPSRFARLLLKLPSGTSEAYVDAILRGLAGARIASDLLLDVCRHAQIIGGSQSNRWLVRLIETYAAGVVDVDLLKIVAAVALTDPDPAEHEPGHAWLAGDIDTAALNSTRGAAALSIGQLVFEDPTRLVHLEAALRQLVTDPASEVRAAATAALASVLNTDAELAVALFKAAVGPISDGVLISRYAQGFVHLAIRRGHFPAVAPLLRQMLNGEDSFARANAARQLAFASILDPRLDSDVDAILNDADDTLRAAVVGVFAENVAYEPRRARCVEVVAVAFDDQAEAVRDAAESVFRYLDEKRLRDASDLIAAFANSRALADGAETLLHALDSSRQPVTLAVLDLCEKVIEIHQHAVGDISKAASGDGMFASGLVLRLYAQHTDTEVRRRCLDLIDRLVVFHAHDIERDLDSIER